MRVLPALVLAAFAVAGCTQTPTTSPAPTTSPGTTAGPTGQPTIPPTPTTGPTTDTGLPSSILGLPTYTVAGISRLSATGALDGRFAAVAGYWAQFALPCPFTPHQPVVLGFCSGGSFADTPDAARNQGGSVDGGVVPITVPESANGQLLWSGSAPFGGSAKAVVLIVHAADGRSWQCAAADRAACHSRLIIDSVAWVNGDVPALNPDTSALPAVALEMTIDAVAAAAVQPGEQLVTAYPLPTTSIQDVDPRFSGQGHGIVWYARVITSAPDANGSAAGEDVLINDESGEVVKTLPLSVDPAYGPARLILDSNGWEGTGDARPRYQVFNGDGSIVSEAWLGSSLTPLALEAGGYTVHAYIGTVLAVPTGMPSCDQPLPLIAGDDLAYYADFSAGSARCTWTSGSLFPM